VNSVVISSNALFVFFFELIILVFELLLIELFLVCSLVLLGKTRINLQYILYMFDSYIIFSIQSSATQKCNTINLYTQLNLRR